MFDIARKDSLKLINIKEDRKFLLAQQENGRRGAIIRADTILAAQKKRTANRNAKEKTKQRKELERCAP